MSAGHTPGPWFAAEAAYTSLSIRSAIGTVCSIQFHRHVTKPGISKEMKIANARLIAAAPMLLEAAQDALDAFQLLRAGCIGSAAEIEVLDAHIDELQCAIAKATTP